MGLMWVEIAIRLTHLRLAMAIWHQARWLIAVVTSLIKPIAKPLVGKP